jgi:hypothetical protein
MERPWRPSVRWTADSAARRRDSRFERGWFAVVAGWRGRSVAPAGAKAAVLCEERELRRVAQAEHGEAVVARDEGDGERGLSRVSTASTDPVRDTHLLLIFQHVMDYMDVMDNSCPGTRLGCG